MAGGNAGRGFGTVFIMDSKGVEAVIHNFGRGTDGAFPAAGLIALNGQLYGTTTGGGISPRQSSECISSGARPAQGYSHLSQSYYRCGTIFKISQFGKERLLHRFEGDPDGANPEAGLAISEGVLYGTTDWGGASAYYGTIFRSFP
jgi:hypothetical protein